jgi:hypothetical protein
MKVMAPGFQGLYNSKEFPVKNIIVLLCRGEQLREIGTGARGEFGSICGNGKQTRYIWKLEYGFGEEGFSKTIEGIGARISPVPGLIFLCEINKRTSYV